jgi:carotenoid cleavage dioxygenase-like enzyme
MQSEYNSTAAVEAAYRLGFSSQENALLIDHLPLRGTVPQWLRGTLIRNGPAKFEVGQQPYRHWFDGLAMLHEFSFRDGQVAYANRFLKSRAYSAAAQTGRISFPEFATDPCGFLFRRIASLFVLQATDNACVNVTRIAGRYLALTETPLPVEFDTKTLETVGVMDYADSLRGQLTTAHPHYDFARAEILNYVTHFSPRSRYTVYRTGKRETRRRPLASMPVREPSYMHSFAVTEAYIILAEFPLVVSPTRLLLRAKPFIENFRWKPERGTRFLIFDRAGRKLKAVSESDAFFAFHHINAWQDRGDVVLDIAGYSDAAIVNALYLERLRRHAEPIPTAKLRRYRIPMDGSIVTYDVIGDECIELPRIHYERCNTKPYQFAYGVSTSKQTPGDFLNQLVKVDVNKGRSRTWFCEGCYPGEPVFVPGPDASKEDEGVVLSVVLDTDRGNSFLLILDGQSFAEIARAEVPQHIPFGFHGQFFWRRRASDDP